jgi:hypothetical protein
VVNWDVPQIAPLRERAAQEEPLAAQAALARREAVRRSIELGSHDADIQGALGSLSQAPGNVAGTGDFRRALLGLWSRARSPDWRG